MSVEQEGVLRSVALRAARWLLTNQGPGGAFAEAGHVIHTEMRRCQDDCPATLTAFVVMALDSELAEFRVSVGGRTGGLGGGGAEGGVYGQ